MNRMNSMDGMSHGFIPKHGGYRNLVVYRVAEIIYDFTFRFCNKYVKNQGRTYDQMVQAAHSGMQNIAEGSVDSGVSKASELKLTGIAKGSLQELKEDYLSYLRQRGLERSPWLVRSILWSDPSSPDRRSFAWACRPAPSAACGWRSPGRWPSRDGDDHPPARRFARL